MLLPDSTVITEDEFDYLLSFLPDDWEEAAGDKGAVKRYRGFKDAPTLLRVLMMHLAAGLSLKETSAWAKASGLADVSSVAIMDRLQQASEWFCHMAKGVQERWFPGVSASLLAKGRNIRLVDATRVKEKGPTGTNWNMHYSLNVSTLRCDEFHVTDRHVGETFKKFDVKAGDIMIGDRVYGVRPGIAHVVNNGGDVVVRFNCTNLPLMLAKEKEVFDLLGHLRTLKGTALGDWDVYFKQDGRVFHGRVCAVRKSPQAIRQAEARVMRRGQKNGQDVAPETLESAEYVMIFTTLAREEYKTAEILELYRGRWQVELAFKRLKSLMEFGHLPKVEEQSILGWIHGKLLVAFLVEALTAKGEGFSPWGYPLATTP
jgi:hypothetical protein